jgi:hypothetical protein
MTGTYLKILFQNRSASSPDYSCTNVKGKQMQHYRSFSRRRPESFRDTFFEALSGPRSLTKNFGDRLREGDGLFEKSPILRCILRKAQNPRGFGSIEKILVSSYTYDTDT